MVTLRNFEGMSDSFNVNKISSPRNNITTAAAEPVVKITAAY
jgi:hypothetical protein